ncbi:MAG: hypothetical protein NTV79_09800 [Candidatus Aureabacteria bacterium]|nr:hypothetical protein [Candidatus Auribacterota bacterium]
MKAEREAIRKLRDTGISIETACAKLLDEWVAAFVDAFQALLQTIERKREKLLKAAPPFAGWEKGKSTEGRRGKDQDGKPEGLRPRQAFA